MHRAHILFSCSLAAGLCVLSSAPLHAQPHQHSHKPIPTVIGTPAEQPQQSQLTETTPKLTANTTSAHAQRTYRIYRTFTPNEPLLDWRKTNETVAAIGGWREYAKEAARANAGTAVTTSPVALPSTPEMKK